MDINGGPTRSARTDWSAVSGVLLCISWAPMAIVLADSISWLRQAGV